MPTIAYQVIVISVIWASACAAIAVSPELAETRILGYAAIITLFGCCTSKSKKED